MAVTEDELCRLFAEKMRSSPEFAAWVLGQTQFSVHQKNARLLHEEQVKARPNVRPERWWRHWWRKIPGSGDERETDVFLVFETTEKERFALHFENKRKATDKFTTGQAEAYHRRAMSMLNDARYLNHQNFSTVLIAQNGFRERNRADADLFQAFISHEEIAKFITEFDDERRWPERESVAITGGCLCGALRYEASAPPRYMGFCFCNDCRKASGSGFIPFMGFTASALRFTGVPLTHTLKHADGRAAVRNFCPACGGLVFGGTVGESDYHTVYAGSLDDPTHFKPTMAIFNRERAPWVALPAGLTVFDGMPS